MAELTDADEKVFEITGRAVGDANGMSVELDKIRERASEAGIDRAAVQRCLSYLAERGLLQESGRRFYGLTRHGMQEWAERYVEGFEEMRNRLGQALAKADRHSSRALAREAGVPEYLALHILDAWRDRGLLTGTDVAAAGRIISGIRISETLRRQYETGA